MRMGRIYIVCLVIITIAVMLSGCKFSRSIVT